MKKILLSALFFSAFSVMLIGQVGNQAKLVPMSEYDMQKLSTLPALEISPASKQRSLPAIVDNSQLPFFRPLIAQVGLECGQASSIGVVFTYEMNLQRNVPGNLPENQYPTHFAYNFINGGSDAGVNFFETFEILKHIGTPNVAEYGGMSLGGPSRWISGYNNYFSGMHNRIEGAYTIKLNTVEGLETLKSWVYDHANGSEHGGVACFYSEFSYPPTVFPVGYPEAGKHVLTQWGNSANHAMSIVGYNDSIRWDYNGDGRFTNDVDLNADGIITISDWEIGGFKFANTYGSISGWGDEGFCYMMYKTVCDRFGQGGIWNNLAAVVKVKETYHPELTAKVNLTYPCRNAIKVMLGVSADTAATEPQYILHYPIFDFQGGCLAMQGNSGDENIEFGLDLNPLLTYINPGEIAKFFLIVSDQSGSSFNQGLINSFSLMDYTDLVTDEYVSDQTNVQVVANNMTMLTIKTAVNFDDVQIENTELPALELYADYMVQMSASGGTGPYNWDLVHDYSVVDSTQSYPDFAGTKLSMGNNESWTGVDLPFSFPFFGEMVSRVYPTTEGFIMFKETLLPWPYYIEGRTYFIENKMIAPCFAKPFYFDGTADNGVWYDGTADSCTFRWKMSTSGVTGNSLVDATVTIFPSGEIRFWYGPHHAPSYIHKFAGLSAGDGINYHLLNEIAYFDPYANQFTLFQPNSVFPGLEMTSDGLLTGSLEELTSSPSIKIRTRDFDHITEIKSYNIGVEGVVIEYDVQSGDDAIIEYGENFGLNLHLRNLYNAPTGTGTITFRSSDPYLIINDSLVEMETITELDSVMISEAFSVAVSNSVPDGHLAACSLIYATGQHVWKRDFTLELNAPFISISSVGVLDGENGILEPGDTAQILVTYKNEGGASLPDVLAQMQCDNPDLTILDNNDNTAEILQNGMWTASFEVFFSETAEPMQTLELQLGITGANDYVYNKTVPLITSLILENFETGTFDIFEWETIGTANWYITDEPVYEGAYAARSGVMGDNGYSVLNLPWDVAYPDTISFYFKVSSEPNYDFLKFQINEVLLEQWSGEVGWAHKVYQVEDGQQVFHWNYTKDYSVSNGLDCGVIDYIILPARNVETAVGENPLDSGLRLSVSPNPFADRLRVDVTVTEATDYEVFVVDSQGRLFYSLHEKANAAGTYSFYPLVPDASGSFYVLLKTAKSRLVKPVIRSGNLH
jgi:hypothetical protein